MLIFIVCISFLQRQSSKPPLAACPGQELWVGHSSLQEKSQDASAIFIGELQTVDKLTYKDTPVVSPRIKVTELIKGSYLRQGDSLNLCPVLSADAYSTGTKFLIFLWGRDQSGLWSPQEGVAGIVPATKEGKFSLEPWEKQPLSSGELRTKLDY